MSLSHAFASTGVHGSAGAYCLAAEAATIEQVGRRDVGRLAEFGFDRDKRRMNHRTEYRVLRVDHDRRHGVGHFIWPLCSAVEQAEGVCPQAGQSQHCVDERRRHAREQADVVGDRQQ